MGINSDAPCLIISDNIDGQGVSFPAFARYLHVRSDFVAPPSDMTWQPPPDLSGGVFKNSRPQRTCLRTAVVPLKSKGVADQFVSLTEWL